MAPPKKETSGGMSSGVRAILLLGFAVIAGIVATFIIWRMFQSYQHRIAEAQRPEDTQYVIVAYADLFQGVTITEEDLYAIEIPPKYLYLNGGEESGLFSSPEHVVGRVPRERILANEFLREDRLADPQEGIGLNAIIPRGMRALSVNIAGGNALSNFLQPGNYVDVLVTIKPEGGGKSETHTLLEAVYVLAVGRVMTREEIELEERAEKTAKGKGKKKKKKEVRGKPSVTMALTPQQAEQVAHAFHEGSITLTLRNDIDVAVTDLEFVTVDDLFGREEEEEKPKARPKPKPKPETTTLQIIEGGKKKNWTFDETTGEVKRGGR